MVYIRNRKKTEISIGSLLMLLVMLEGLIIALLYLYGGYSAVTANWHILAVSAVGVLMLLSNNIMARWLGRTLIGGLIVGVFVMSVV